MNENRLWALIAYALAPIGSLVALLLAENDPTLRLHAKQGLLAGLAGAVISTILSLVPVLNCIAMPFAMIFWIYLIICGVRAYQGQDVIIPLISTFEV